MERVSGLLDIGSNNVGPASPSDATEQDEARALDHAARCEAALHAGDLETALELARQARALASRNVSVALRAVVVFCATGARDEAIAAFDLLDTAGQLTPDQRRHLSGLLAEEGSIDSSVHHALGASRADPDNWEFARHCGILLNFAGRSTEAAGYLVRAARNHSADALVFYQLSVACAAIGRSQQAALFAERAWSLEPENPAYVQAHAHHLLQDGQAAEAVFCIEQAFDAEVPETADLWFMMSVSRSEMKDFEGAVSAASAGLAIREQHVGLLMQRGIVLCSLGRYDDALADMEAILTLDPNNVEAQRVSFAATSAAGRYGDAVPFGAAILRAFPDDEPIGRSLLHILTRRFLSGGAVDIDGRGLAELKRKTIHQRRTRHQPGPLAALVVQLRVIGALILRETRGRFGRAKLGYLWALFEPLLHISLLVAIIQFMAKGDPPVGTSFPVFYFTGIIPYHLFTHIGGSLMSAVRANRALLQLPPVTTLDVFVSRTLLEIATEFVVAIVLISLFLIIGLQALPVDWLRFVMTFFLVGGCAYGVGVINAALSAYFHSWEKVWSISIAVMYFTSGTFYIPAMMPVEMRDILVWSPIVQGIEMFRSSMFEGHQPQWLDIGYLTTLSFILVGTGVAVERLTRRKLLEQE